MIVTVYAIASLVEETHLKEDYVIPKVNDPRICRNVTQTLKEAIGNHVPKPLKDSTETRQLNEQQAGKKVECDQVHNRSKTAKRIRKYCHVL